MKSLKFSIPGNFDKILDGSKTLTIRGLYIPDFEAGDVIKLQEMFRTGTGKRPGRSTNATVVDVIPIRLHEITDDMARDEGFTNAEESRSWLKETYKARQGRWFFLVRWEKTGPVQETLFTALKIKK